MNKDKKTPKEATDLFKGIIKASVKDEKKTEKPKSSK